ncbi:MAG: TspO/MBR family protein [Haloarculaceae archaeon]
MALSRERASDRSALVACIAVCELAGLVPGYLTREDITDWYRTLEKPERTPPGWVFGPVWTTLYLLMGVASYLVRQEADDGDGRAVGLFVLQLTLNAVWSLVFFGRRTPLGGVVVIAFLLPAVALTTVAFYRVDRRAGLLLVPYLLWTAFATTLNFDVWRLNK